MNAISNPEQAFTDEQKEYLAGLMAGLSHALNPQPSTLNEPQADPTVHGTPLSELCKQERWKYDEEPLDIWDKLLAHADENKFPDEADTFRFRYHGLFHVAPTQNAFMLRCRIPAGELTAAQMHGLADIAHDWGGDYADITTRSNIQIREIVPQNIIKVLTKLQESGLTSRGSGVDNVRNITASPTAGIDPTELIDTRPLAKALHHYILNHRDLYGLPRKFNVAFDGGGGVSVVADTNDIGFIAVRVTEDKRIEPGIYFRVELAGITGHKQFARDAGIIVKLDQAVAVAAAMIRVFSAHGCRTDRKKARLKYLIDQWGISKFLEEVGHDLAFPLVEFPREHCSFPQQPLRHGHLGIYKQSQRGFNYIGVTIPVGRMRTAQMRRLADLAQNYGSGHFRLTPWQNLLIPNVPDAFVETVKRNLVRIGFHYEASAIAGGVVACTGNSGCKWASTNTKGQAIEIARYLENRVQLDQPINIHLTGCPHSCAQHYIGDIGLLGTKTTLEGESVEAYNVVLGGGFGHDQTIAKEVFKGIPFSAMLPLLERVLKVYVARRKAGESFAAFARRHETKELQEMFSQ
jgi:ferredoxin-nitrite reductase